MKEITFKDKVYKKLVELPPLTEYIIEKKVSEAMRPEFIEAVKEFIRFDYGIGWGFRIEFRDDYYSLKKKEIK